MTFIPTVPTQAYKAVILIGSTQIPIIGEPALQAPENDVNPPIIGNWYESANFASGLINPVVTFNFAVRDSASEVLSAAFLNPFFNRTNDSAHDTTIITGGIAFWDGRSGFQMNGVKADMLSISMTKTGGVQISGRFCASDLEGTEALVPLVSAPSFTAWDHTALLYGQNITWGGAYAGRIWSGSMALANNHRPNMVMNGDRFPADQNASQQTASGQITMRAADSEPTDGTAITATITGANITRSFTIANPKCQTNKNRQVSWPEPFRNYAFKCMGATGNAPAMTYS